MKVAQVLTLVSADGAYGGPAAVARAQCEALADLGHEVTLFAGWDGRAELSIPGVDVRLFRVRRVLPVSGFAVLKAPGLSRTLVASDSSFDIVHMHLGRDLVTLPAARAWARRPGPFVVQTHGMVLPDGRLRARLVDVLWTRPVLRAASAQLVLTDAEEVSAPRVARAPIVVARIRNGVKPSELRAAWSAVAPEVIYCARLHERKRATEFVSMAAELVRRGVTARFTIAGPDEGELADVRKRIAELSLGDRVTYVGSLDPLAVLPRLSQAQIYVLPSVDEPFPMGVLEAMSVGLPAIITDSTGISRELARSEGVIVTDGSAMAMASAVARLLRSGAAWSVASSSARAEVLARYSAKAVALELTALYTAVGRAAPSS